MRRRCLPAALLACVAAPAIAQQPDGDERPRRRISAAALHDGLATRFPRRIGVRGLLEVQVSAPALLLMPARNRLGATLRAELASPSRSAVPAGELDVVFALRYEPLDRSVRAQRPEVLELRWPDLAPDAADTLARLLPALLRDVGEIVLHRFTPRELALPDALGLEPTELRVLEDGLLIVFGSRTGR